MLRSAAASDVGQRRRVNEDSYAVVPELGLYVVADGLGGHQAGQHASRLAVEATVRVVRTLRGASASLTEKLRYAVTNANREVFEASRQDPERAGMGTTLVALLVEDGRAALAHVGDSRAYRVAAGSIRQLTDDHSVVGELLRSHQISPDAARDHPHRHVLTRALGIRPEVEADLGELGFETGDVFVLCTDGLTNLVLDEEIAKGVGQGEDLERVCQRLVDLANVRGGDDNITVALVRRD